MRGNGDFRDSAQRKFPNHFLFLCIKIISTKTNAIVDYWYLFFYLGWFCFYFHMILFCAYSSLTDWLFCTARLKNCWKKWKSHLAHWKAISSPDIDWKSNENVLPNVHLTKVLVLANQWPLTQFDQWEIFQKKDIIQIQIFLEKLICIILKKLIVLYFVWLDLQFII